MTTRKTFIIFILLNIGCTFPTFCSNSQGSTLRQQIETTIKKCETKYKDLQLKETLFDPGPKPKIPSKPGFFTSKEKYNTANEQFNEQIKAWTSKKDDLEKKRVVFKRNLWQLAEFMSKEKIKLRLLPERELVENSREFSSNCTRFSEGISGFVDWSLGKNPQHAKFYILWMDENYYKNLKK